jgi:hypothetical protein
MAMIRLVDPVGVNKAVRSGLAWCFLLMGLGLTVACVPPKVQTRQAPQFEPSAISSVALLSFRSIDTPQWGSRSPGEGVRHIEELLPQFSLPGTDHVEQPPSRRKLYVVPEQGARRITDMVLAALVDRPALRVVGPPETDVVFKENAADDPAKLWKAMALEAGALFRVDGVLVGLVRTYREREGSKLGAKPAAVGFELYLLNPTDGKVLWAGEYFEEQKPLNEDILGIFDKGIGFVTVEELAAIGVKKVMKAFPVGK